MNGMVGDRQLNLLIIVIRVHLVSDYLSRYFHCLNVLRVGP